MVIKELKSVISNGGLNDLFAHMYGEKFDREKMVKRYSHLTDDYARQFNNDEVVLFSTPGRTEISGNHTDHNNGKVLAASINLDIIGVAGFNNDNKINVISKGYENLISVDLTDLNFKKEEIGTSQALVRGVVKGLKERGYGVQGFNAALTSDVPAGSGLSSSASFEVIIGTIINSLFNKGIISSLELAQTGQYAENIYFGKPCGLMDQITCAVGGIVAIDFKSHTNPLISKIHFDFNKSGYDIIVVDTGGNHADLTDEYASIPGEMISAAKELGKEKARDLSLDDLINNSKLLRDKVGDRSLLRVMHYLSENRRVDEQIKFLEEGKFNLFLSLVNESGNSSFKYLQNCYNPKTVNEQGISLALSISEEFIKEIGEGASRVHGGGFEGTIEAFIPEKHSEEYINLIEKVFGRGKAIKLAVRNKGSMQLEL